MVLKSSPNNFYLLLLYVLCNEDQCMVYSAKVSYSLHHTLFLVYTCKTFKFYTTYMVATITADNKGNSSVAYKPIEKSLQELSHSLHHPGLRDHVMHISHCYVIVIYSPVPGIYGSKQTERTRFVNNSHKSLCINLCV